MRKIISNEIKNMQQSEDETDSQSVEMMLEALLRTDSAPIFPISKRNLLSSAAIVAVGLGIMIFVFSFEMRNVDWNFTRLQLAALFHFALLIMGGVLTVHGGLQGYRGVKGARKPVAAFVHDKQSDGGISLQIPGGRIVLFQSFGSVDNRVRVGDIGWAYVVNGALFDFSDRAIPKE